MLDRETELLLSKLREVEEALEQRLEAKRVEFNYRVEQGKVVFETEIRERHKRFKTGLLTFLRQSKLSRLITSPVIYSLILPFLMLDLSIILYQAVCFPIWGIKSVPRSDYIVIDRHKLAYLNLVEKLNCVYCGYANGLAALVTEVASRTEQYWCPIKHARRIKNAHARYGRFVDYGDAEGFRARLAELRDELSRS
ncbi:MAG: hypothetical protein HQL45_16055 [Alphaproteobacteria bacterium]|nr:hypothetical protein [Alphaproteobacteria bacterium]MBF0355981.1 hypothetical protein [Alphaproteobacteria bacterium]